MAELLRRLSATASGHDWLDLGGDGSDPNDDYPDFAQALGHAIRDGRAERGILICGSGVGARTPRSATTHTPHTRASSTTI